MSGRRTLAVLVCARAEEIFGGLEAIPAWQTVIAAEPALAVGLSEAQLDSALAAIANFVDLKSPFTLGHSVAVADLAGEAGHRLGLPREDVLVLRRAGLVHGFGRLGVSNAIWDRPGPLSAGEWERIRMYPYLGHRTDAGRLSPQPGRCCAGSRRMHLCLTLALRRRQLARHAATSCLPTPDRCASGWTASGPS